MRALAPHLQAAEHETVCKARGGKKKIREEGTREGAREAPPEIPKYTAKYDRESTYVQCNVFFIFSSFSHRRQTARHEISTAV